MENWKYHIQTLSVKWYNPYCYISPGDLVLVGPVSCKRLGIAVERKVVCFGTEPDEWDVLIDGQIETHSHCYLYSYDQKEIQPKYDWYNYYQRKGVSNND